MVSRFIQTEYRYRLPKFNSTLLNARIKLEIKWAPGSNLQELQSIPLLTIEISFLSIIHFRIANPTLARMLPSGGQKMNSSNYEVTVATVIPFLLTVL